MNSRKDEECIQSETEEKRKEANGNIAMRESVFIHARAEQREQKKM